MLSLIKHRGIQVLLVLALYFSLAPLLPHVMHQGLYTVSLLIKDVLMWMLPITVGLFIAHAVNSFQHKAPLFVITLLIFETVSNFSSVWYTYLCGHAAAEFLPHIQIMPEQQESIAALWRLSWARPAWWAADKGALFGLVIGFLAAFKKSGVFAYFVTQGKNKAEWLLTKVFSRLIPLFVLGFVARMYKMQLLQQVTGQYGPLLIWLVIFLLGYILLLFLIGNGFSLKNTLKAIKNLMPAGGLAFTSGCSISTMPWTIEGTSKNLKHPHLAKAVIPATTNIQQIGDCIINSFLCFLIYRYYFGHTPDFMTWLAFTSAFVLARFATAAVIGGAIFVMLPVYEKYLSFNPEMIAIILALNVVLDPLVTSSNVIANGALCRLFERVYGRNLVKSVSTNSKDGSNLGKDPI